jgi:hypothetical protein
MTNQEPRIIKFDPMEKSHDLGCEIQHTGKCSCGYDNQEQFNWEKVEKELRDTGYLKYGIGGIPPVIEIIKETCVPRDDYYLLKIKCVTLREMSDMQEKLLKGKLQKVREWANEEEKYPLPNDLLRETKATIIQGRTQAKEELKKLLDLK